MPHPPAQPTPLDPDRITQVDYHALDAVKLRMIEASRQTLRFAERYGHVINPELGASANIFALDLKPFWDAGATELKLTMLPEGLGTADDARPEDLSTEEEEIFWHNIAYKAMAALTNDTASSGLQVIAVGIYLPSSTPESVFSEAFLDGFSRGMVESCREVGCVYLSGETPQLQGKIVEGKLDVAGAVVALTPPGQQQIDSRELADGDRIVFVESAGVHENGFTGFRSLAARLPDGYHTRLSDQPGSPEYWQALNKPSKLYTPLVQAVMAEGVRPTNIEPISGHGWQKLMRVGSPHGYVIEQTLPPQKIFSFIQTHTEASNREMLEKFNMGVGQAIFVRDAAQVETVIDVAAGHGLRALEAGKVCPSTRRVVDAKPYGTLLDDDHFSLRK